MLPGKLSFGGLVDPSGRTRPVGLIGPVEEGFHVAFAVASLAGRCAKSKGRQQRQVGGLLAVRSPRHPGSPGRLTYNDWVSVVVEALPAVLRTAPFHASPSCRHRVDPGFCVPGPGCEDSCPARTGSLAPSGLGAAVSLSDQGGSSKRL